MRLLSFLLFLTATSASAQRFTLTNSLRTGAYGAAAWGDYDGDGRKDLAYGAQTAQAGLSDFLHIYHNTTAGMVLLTPALPYMSNPSMTWADLNNDGKDELIITGMGSTGGGATTVYTYDGVGALVEMTSVQIPGFSAGSVAAVDYNNDGWKDIAMMGFDSSSQVNALILKGGAGLSFTPIRTPVVGAHFGEMKWGDFNNDGLADLLVNGYEANTPLSRTRIYQNMGADSFQMLSTTYRGLSGTVDWLDYDGDGKPDFLTTGTDTSGTNSLTDLYHNDGNGIFSRVTTNLPDFGEPSAVAIADFNQDGKPDVALGGGTAFSNTYSAIAYGTGTATFLLDTIYQGDVQNCIAEAADFDGDSYPDLLFGSNLLRNRGSAAAVKNISAPVANACLSPNPVAEDAVLQWKSPVSGKAMLTLHDATGRMIWQRQVKTEVGENQLPVSFKDVAPGIYFLRVGNSEALRVEKR